ncbi:MAG: fluoride efflux transporter CrcB [Paracoccus sp. (in: a-proteobacteria)]|nr:fluoride efflux transporter CrcB [Paracoccus sp. (in: a-proteobacteria)]
MSMWQVALGGAVGASLRYGVNMLAARALAGWPAATLAVNVLGSFAMGVLVVALAQRGQAAVPFLLTGLLGGFTTFSAFSLDTLVLWERGDHLAAGIYVAASVGLSLAAIIAGLAVARGFYA